MNGKTLQKTWLGLSHKGWLTKALEIILIFSLGMIAVLVHSRLKTPLNIPGKHGIIFMALFTAVRIGSNFRYAASIASLGTGFMLLMPIAGFSDPFAGFHYMLPGFVLDLFSLKNRNWKSSLFLVLIISGLAYMLIPLSRIIFMLFGGVPYNAFIKHGILAPVLFFLFGSTGGLIGAGFIRLFKKKN